MIPKSHREDSGEGYLKCQCRDGYKEDACIELDLFCFQDDILWTKEIILIPTIVQKEVEFNRLFYK